MHPEVIGLVGYSDGKGIVSNSFDDIKKTLEQSEQKRFVVVSQTTQDTQAYKTFTKA